MILLDMFTKAYLKDVLSPILYSIYVFDLERLFHYNPDIKILQYADDVCIYTLHKTLSM